MTIATCRAVYRILAVVLLGISLPGAAAMGDVIVVVSVKNPLTNLTRDEVSDIFLGKTIRLRNGEPVVPVNQIEGSSARGEFFATFAGKSAAQIKAYWSKMIFTGRGQPPKEVANSLEVKRFVAGHAGAIGYIDSGALGAGVKSVTVSP